MATRQTGRKTAAKPAAKSAAGRGAHARSVTVAKAPAASSRGSTAKSVTAAKPPAGGRGSAAKSATAEKAAAAGRGWLRWWRAAVKWAGGGVPFSTLVVSVLGLADSVYLVIEHFTSSTTLACPENATFNCLKVTTSPWSYLPAGPVSWSVPVSVAGLAFFVFMLVVNSPWGWRARWPVVHWARLISVSVGMLLVLYLIWAELFRINAICLFCTGVHVLTFILFALVVGKVTFSGVRAVPDTR